MQDDINKQLAYEIKKEMADRYFGFRKLIEQGASTSEAARRAATETGVSRRVIYQALLSDQGET